MTSSFVTATRTHSRTLRYVLRSREIYAEEPITSPEILSEPPPTPDDSTNTVQETPCSQFRLALSVTPCMPRTSSLEYTNHSSSPQLFSPTPNPTLPHAPTPNPNSPQDQPSPPLPNPTNSPCNSNSQHEKSLPGSPELFSPTPTSSIIQNNWPFPPPLPQRSPRIRRRHKIHNYESLASTNESYDVLLRKLRVWIA